MPPDALADAVFPRDRGLYAYGLAGNVLKNAVTALPLEARVAAQLETTIQTVLTYAYRMVWDASSSAQARVRLGPEETIRRVYGGVSSPWWWHPSESS